MQPVRKNIWMKFCFFHPFFQLYNEVQARRGANDISQAKDGGFECGRDHHPDTHHCKNPPGTIAVPHHYSNSCNYGPNGCSYPVSHQNGYAYCRANGVSEIGDLLQDYLGQGKQMIQKNNRARHVVSKVKTDVLIIFKQSCCLVCTYMHGKTRYSSCT